jgi:regulatory protein
MARASPAMPGPSIATPSSITAASLLSALISLLSFNFRLSTFNLLLFYPPLMFGAPRKLSSESDLYNAALRALMRRAHSVFEMRQALERRTEDKSLVKKVLARLKQNGMLDDARYAKQFARYRAESRRQGKFRIARDLRARGVPDRHIEAALEELSQETDEATLVCQRIHRKLKLLRGEIDDRKLASIYRSLLRAGFSSDVIRRELRAMTKENPPEIELDIDETS